jgi:hypothetical protein
MKNLIYSIIYWVMILTCTTIIICNYIQNNTNLLNGTTHGTSNITHLQHKPANFDKNASTIILFQNKHGLAQHTCRTQERCDVKSEDFGFNHLTLNIQICKIVFTLGPILSSLTLIYPNVTRT